MQGIKGGWGQGGLRRFDQQLDRMGWCEGVRIRNEVPDGGPHEGRLSSRSLLIPGPKCHLRRAASVSRDPVFPRGPLPETLDPGGIKRDAL
ncbi:hypothetical protein CEXT_665101 [Caerostris extrusa]|uniref:Uncharacterized protein n=1 Tax=Caerostris extrusa TaxID=172846 RepID=A0AAV4RGL8_CAEEX|nr:hypothetical protein CEXT_665101 [Caerostris extrusa]